MTFLAPGFLLAAAAAALAAVALHFLSFQQPRPQPLPTARFLPDRPVRAVASFRRPTDLVLLALRVLALLLVGAAFARPARPAERGSVARVLLIDRSRAVASGAETADSVRRLAREGDVLVLFDSAAAPAVSSGAPATAAPAVGPTGARGSLSAAFLAAGRAARLVGARADSVELVLVSPLAREELDAATLLLRRAWPGRVRVARVAAAAVDTVGGTVELRGAAPGDPFVATHALLATSDAAPAEARVVRGSASDEDFAWARAAPGRRLVVWPRGGAPAGWRPTASDTVGAVVSNEVVVVAPFARVAVAPTAGGARAAARWVDGTPAAIERPLGAGCVREVGVPVPAAGDLALAPTFVRFAAALTGSCGGPRDGRGLDAAAQAALAGGGPLATTAAVGGPADDTSPLVPWLLAAAVVALGVEMLARRRDPERRDMAGAIP